MRSNSAVRGLECVSSTLRAAVAARIASLDAPDVESAGRDHSADLAWEAIEDADLSPFVARVAEVAARLDLDQLSLEAMWLCAGPELDDHIGRVFAFLLDDPTRLLATPRLIATLLTNDDTAPRQVLASLGADSPLRRRGCIHLAMSDIGIPLADQPIRLAPELAGFLLDTQLHESAADPRLRRRDLPQHPIGRDATVARIQAALRVRGEAPLVVSGPDGIELLALAAHGGLVLIDARGAGDHELVSRAGLIAALEGRRVAFSQEDLLTPQEGVALGAAMDAGVSSRVLCTSTTEQASRLGRLEAIFIEAPTPTPAERRAAWTALTGVRDTDEVAAKFRLSTAQIARAARAARHQAELAGREAPDAADLDAGARHASRSGLGDRAVRLAPDSTWDELVLPDRPLEQLRSISAYLRHRDQVLTEWGFDRLASGRLGLSVLFAGESGTGKTMAARVLAGDLGLELFAINLATVVSKFVGETEQNLERIFAAAEGSNAILLFDEADALFGRRSEVSDASDRYANIEVAYLLQRVEAHTGAVILTTNLKQNLDVAFMRRLDFVVDFALPNEGDRRRMWRMVVPARAPTADDIDYDFLADRFKLSGGSIRNCALAAAFEAAAAGQPMRMAHIVRAIAAEYRKLGRLTIENDFGPYFGMLRDAEAQPEREVAPEPPPEPPVAVPEAVRVASRIEEL